jgi:hypothetical protein
MMPALPDFIKDKIDSRPAYKEEQIAAKQILTCINANGKSAREMLANAMSMPAKSDKWSIVSRLITILEARLNGVKKLPIELFAHHATRESTAAVYTDSLALSGECIPVVAALIGKQSTIRIYYLTKYIDSVHPPFHVHHKREDGTYTVSVSIKSYLRSRNYDETIAELF